MFTEGYGIGSIDERNPFSEPKESSKQSTENKRERERIAGEVGQESTGEHHVSHLKEFGPVGYHVSNLY